MSCRRASEAQARKEIDRLPQTVGWCVQDPELNHSHASRGAARRAPSREAAFGVETARALTTKVCKSGKTGAAPLRGPVRCLRRQEAHHLLIRAQRRTSRHCASAAAGRRLRRGVYWPPGAGRWLVEGRKGVSAKKPDVVSPSVATLYRAVRAVMEQARASAYRTVNVAMVRAYSQVGCLIVEHEQKGKARAAYREAMLEELSRRLMAMFGRGFGVTNLRKIRQFYLMFEIRDAVGLESSKPTRDALRLASAANTARHRVCDELSWSHCRLLMQVEDPASREWYMHEAVDQHWSTRRIERQISVLYYERLLSSRKKAPVRNEADAQWRSDPVLSRVAGMTIGCETTT